jgi:hypothetical protein
VAAATTLWAPQAASQRGPGQAQRSRSLAQVAAVRGDGFDQVMLRAHAKLRGHVPLADNVTFGQHHQPVHQSLQLSHVADV